MSSPDFAGMRDGQRLRGQCFVRNFKRADCDCCVYHIPSEKNNYTAVVYCMSAAQGVAVDTDRIRTKEEFIQMRERAEEETERRQRKEWAKWYALERAWGESKPLTLGSPAAAYFEHRGLRLEDLSIPDSLRWTDWSFAWLKGEVEYMSTMERAEGRMLLFRSGGCCQVTLLDEEFKNRKNEKGKNIRQNIKAPTEPYFCLDMEIQPGRPVVMAEGLEKLLAVRTMLGERFTYICVAGGGKFETIIQNIYEAAGIRDFVIFADRDPPSSVGERAGFMGVMKAILSVATEDVSIQAFFPPQDKDWDDAMRRLPQAPKLRNCLLRDLPLGLESQFPGTETLRHNIMAATPLLVPEILEAEQKTLEAWMQRHPPAQAQSMRNWIAGHFDFARRPHPIVEPVEKNSGDCELSL